LSEFDLVALSSEDDQLGQERRYGDAAEALRAFVAASDVENAARSPETRRVESCRIAVRTAQALAAQGKADEALAAARKLRDADPTDGELAYRQGWCLARLGKFDAPTK